MPSLIETLTKFGQSLLAGAEIEYALPDVLELVIQDTKAERVHRALWSERQAAIPGSEEKGMRPRSDLRPHQQQDSGFRKRNQPAFR